MRKLLVVIVTFIGVAIFMLSFAELEKILDVISHGNVRLLFAAALIQLIWHLNEASAYQSLYRRMGMDEDIRHLTLVSSAANFINVIAPSAGVGGIALFTDDAGKRGLPHGRAAASAALYLFLDYAAFLAVLILGLIVLIRRNDLSAGDISASILMFALVSGFGSLLYIGSRSAQRYGDALAFLARIANGIMQPFIRRKIVSEDRAHQFAAEMSEGLTILRANPQRLIRPILHALNSKALQIGILLIVFIDFRVDYSIGTLIAGFAITYLFLVISPTPSGIGIVEGIMPLILSTLHVPWEEAVVTTLAYRAVTFWFPLALGGLSFRMIQRAEKTGEQHG
jgi:hypothetical protein